MGGLCQTFPVVMLYGMYFHDLLGFIFGWDTDCVVVNGMTWEKQDDCVAVSMEACSSDQLDALLCLKSTSVHLAASSWV